jgi:uncharacterized membrane protein
MQTPPLSEAPAGFRTPTVLVHHLPAYTPLRWLKLAYQDMRHAPVASLFYGLVFTMMGWLLHSVFTQSVEILLSLITTFTLLGPFLALGLYDISQQLAQTGQVNFLASLIAWRKNYGAISFYSLLLIIVAVSWMRISAILLALCFTHDNPPLPQILESVFLFKDNIRFMIIYVLAGAAFAAVVFALSVVAVPMMLERDCDTITAVVVSIKTVLTNPMAMLFWALLIATFTFIGLATAYIGLIFTMPLIGHASWHAYRALIGWQIHPS